MVILGVVVFTVLFAIGSPIFVALGAGGLIIILFHSGLSINQPALLFFESINSFVLLAVPLFILAGNIMVRGGISKPLIELFASFTARLPGGLAVAAIIASTFVGALTGSTNATLAMVGLVMFPAMMEAKYDRGYSGGVLCASCSLGYLIPPSIMFILFGYLTETSVARLFMAGIMPGLLLAVLLSVTAIFIARGKKFAPAPSPDWKERVSLLVKALPAIFMPVIILGGIYSGIFTPTEAGGVACVYGLLVGAFVYRGLNWKSSRACLTNTAELTGRILVIITAGMLLGKGFMLAGFPTAISNAIIGAGLGPMAFLLLVILAFLLLGMIMEPAVIIFVLIPLVWKSAMALGVDPFHLGAVFCISVLVAGITPPVAYTLFFTSSILDVPIEELMRGVLPFLGAMIVAMVIITLFPEISTWLPSTMLGG